MYSGAKNAQPLLAAGEQRAGLRIVIPCVDSRASLSLQQQCVGDALQKQANKTSYPHIIHNIVCACVGCRVFVCVSLYHRGHLLAFKYHGINSATV